MTYTMREPCPDCTTTYGIIETVNGQDTVRCGWCKRFCYNAPKSETGREPRSLRTRPNIKPSQRTRILLRDSGCCVICHNTENLDVGHLISDHDGRAMGLSEQDLYHDENLAAMCAACNSGLSSETVPLRLFARVLLIRINNMEHAARRSDTNGAKQKHTNT